MFKKYLTSTKFILAGTVALMALFAGSATVMAGEPFPVVGETFGRTCELVFPGSKNNPDTVFTVLAGPSGLPDNPLTPLVDERLDPVYPKIVNCPGSFAKCSNYTFEVVDPGSLNHALATMPSYFTLFQILDSTDAAISSADVEVPIGDGLQMETDVGVDIFDKRLVRFNSDNNVLRSTLTVDLSVARNTTFGSRLGNTNAWCGILGPGEQVATFTGTTQQSSLICQQIQGPNDDPTPLSIQFEQTGCDVPPEFVSIFVGLTDCGAALAALNPPQTAFSMPIQLSTLAGEGLSCAAGSQCNQCIISTSFNPTTASGAYEDGTSWSICVDELNARFGDQSEAQDETNANFPECNPAVDGFNNCSWWCEQGGTCTDALGPTGQPLPSFILPYYCAP